MKLKSIFAASIALGAILAASGCEQSTIVLDPIVNKPAVASTAPTQGTLTVNVNLTAQGANHAGKPFSILLFQNGTLFAAQYNNAAGTAGVEVTGTGGTAGQATLILKAVNASNCPTATNATLLNGSYDYYFAIQYAAETPTVVNTGLTGTTCSGTMGFIQYSSGASLYTSRGSVTIKGDSTLTIGNSGTVLGVQHTFDFATGSAWNYRCYITDANTSAYSATVHLISIYSRNGNGTALGAGGNTHLLPAGAYKYFCYADTNTDANFFQTGTDKLATGIMTVTGASVTYLVAGNFTTL